MKKLQLILLSVPLWISVCMSSGCMSEKPKELVTGEFEKIDCTDYANYATTVGILNNNVWNKGASPWAPEPKFEDTFPVAIDSLSRFNVVHHLATMTNGNHNTATSLWLTNSKYEGSVPNPEVIAAEIMIWTYTTEGHFSPAGKKVDEIAVNGEVWEVWYQANWQDLSGQNHNRWRILTFKSVKNYQIAHINALQMLQYAQDEALIEQGLFVADVELGNEIMTGSGIAWVRQFEVNVEKQKE